MQTLLKQIRRTSIRNIKLYKRTVPHANTKEEMDPLRLYNGMDNQVSFTKMIRDIERRRVYMPNSTSIAVYLYWMAKLDVPSDYIVNSSTNELDLLRGKFEPREAFGFYYGALGNSVPKNILAVAREEYSRIAKANGSGAITRASRTTRAPTSSG